MFHVAHCFLPRSGRIIDPSKRTQIETNGTLRNNLRIFATSRYLLVEHSQRPPLISNLVVDEMNGSFEVVPSFLSGQIVSTRNIKLRCERRCLFISTFRCLVLPC